MLTPGIAVGSFEPPLRHRSLRCAGALIAFAYLSLVVAALVADPPQPRNPTCGVRPAPIAPAQLASPRTSPGPAPTSTDWAARAKAVTWTLDPRATIIDSLYHLDHYDLLMSRVAADGWASLGIQLEKDGRPIYGWPGHMMTPFVVDGDVLYYADFSPIASGTGLVAVDLTTGTVMWKTDLVGIGPVAHSKYFNRVALAVDADVITVQGEEAYGSYVELVDRTTGKTLATDVRRHPVGQ